MDELLFLEIASPLSKVDDFVFLSGYSLALLEQFEEPLEILVLGLFEHLDQRMLYVGSSHCRCFFEIGSQVAACR